MSVGIRRLGGMGIGGGRSPNRINALRYSETIDTAGVASGIWTTSGAAGAANAASGIYAVTEDTSTGGHLIAQVPDVAIVPATTPTKFTVRLAGDTATKAFVAGNNGGAYALANLTAGTIDDQGGLLSSATIEAAGTTANGKQLYDVTIHYTHGGAASGVRIYVADAAGAASFTGTSRRILVGRTWVRPASVTTGYVATGATADP